MKGSPGSKAIEFGCVVPPWFDDRPVAIIGGGQSLRGFDFDRLRGRCHVIAVKGTIFDLPWACCGVGIDHPRLRDWREKLDAVSMPVYWGVTPEELQSYPLVRPKPVTYLRKLPEWRISDDPGAIHAGGTSGFGAIGVAVLKKAKNIFLFGFDYFAADKSFRHNPQHYAGARQPDSPVSWAIWAYHYNAVAHALKVRGVNVQNASPDSRISAFPKVSLEQAVESIYRVRPEGGGCVCRGAIERASAHDGADPDPRVGA